MRWRHYTSNTKYMIATSSIYMYIRVYTYIYIYLVRPQRLRQRRACAARPLLARSGPLAPRPLPHFLPRTWTWTMPESVAVSMVPGPDRWPSKGNVTFAVDLDGMAQLRRVCRSMSRVAMTAAPSCSCCAQASSPAVTSSVFERGMLCSLWRRLRRMDGPGSAWRSGRARSRATYGRAIACRACCCG